MFYQLIQIGSLIPGFFPGILGGKDTSMGIAGLFFGASGAMTIGLGVYLWAMPNLHEVRVDMTEAQQVFGAIGRATITKLFCLSNNGAQSSNTDNNNIKGRTSDDGTPTTVSTGIEKTEYKCWLDCVSVKNGGRYPERVIRDAHQVVSHSERSDTKRSDFDLRNSH